MILIAGAITLGLFVLNKKSDAGGGSAASSPPPADQNWWTRFDALFKTYAAREQVDWQDLKAIALNESDLGREKSVARGIASPADVAGSKSSDGKSWGLMQVTLTTARGLDPGASEAKLNSPEYSIMLAAKYIGQLQRQFSMVELRWKEWVIKSYNQGPGNTAKEKSGLIPKGYADEYWNRFQRNLERVKRGTP